MKTGFPEALEWRKDPITGVWVIVAPQRSGRPYDFDSLSGRSQNYPCVFCKGMEQYTPDEVFRVEGDDGQWLVRVFPNKFPALLLEEKIFWEKEGLFYEKMGGFGVHEVIVETPEHYLSFAEFSLDHMREVVYTYRERMRFWEKEQCLKYCLIFKNQGMQAGASMFHPHSQLIVTPIVPKRVEEEILRARDFYRSEHRCMFCALMEEEERGGTRLVFKNEHFLVLVPYAARFSYEVWILPTQHSAYFTEFAELNSFAEALKLSLQALTKALGEPIFNFVLHGAPYRRGPEDEDHRYCYHWHLEVIPFPVRMAGFEWGTGFYINSVAPEKAAATLRRLVESKVGEKCVSD